MTAPGSQAHQGPADANSLKPGDEVRVYERNIYRNGPEGGLAARVSKVGRKYATAAYEVVTTDWHGEPKRKERTIEFDMETGREKGSQSNYGAYIKTPEQADLDVRQQSAIATLLTRKIRLDSGHSLTLEQIEALAEVARTFSATPAEEAGNV
jgi:hypothetical protein